MTVKMHSDEEQSSDGSRAVFYNLFANMLGREINKSWLDSGFQSELLRTLPDSEGKTALLNSLAKASAVPEGLREIQLDYEQLFIIPGPKLTFPYESCYTHRNMDGTYGRIWQEPARAMYKILKDWDIHFPEGQDLIPDHIAVELFFMAGLCQKQSIAQGSEKRILEDWQVRFFGAHIKNWVCEFLANLVKKADTGYYQGCAVLLGEFLEEEAVEISAKTAKTI
ncbi:anaerobic dehydrogenase protein-like protein [Desulfitobacterium hafniense DCB-2]|uniref:Anaerobic dehydrogenase protein-like protein n=1 Tax=Desulfitobacterium hafniense (strain DSM 10664 / DCB-2) TaxID=272564 RepID=B8G141_DESHD|nr:molecular chaperone TorD family protein [Desulfitobacterium hafniense]ACL19256.1 anaerobic dehydrogenase protein-like protein [Desulfitobacterium hafniense DCB-2]